MNGKVPTVRNYCLPTNPLKSIEGGPVDAITGGWSNSRLARGEKRQCDTACEVELLRIKRPRTRSHLSISTTEQVHRVTVMSCGYPLKQVRLTQGNLALLDKVTGGKHINKTLASPESAGGSSTTKSTSTSTPGFAIQAYKNGILEPRYSKPPTNLEDLRLRFAQPRETPYPPESMYEDYADRVGGAVNESTMVFEVGGKLLKDNYGVSKSAGINNSISAPQPDFIEGLEIQQYEPFPIDEFIKGAMLYKRNPSSLSLPHIAGEWKRRENDMERARLQSAYEPDPPGHAAVTTFNTDGSSLNIFVHYATSSENSTPKYHQYPIKSINLTDSYEGLKNGRKELRNEQDYAKEQSYILRDELKEHWKYQDGLQYIAESIAEDPPISDIQQSIAESIAECRGNAHRDEAGYEVIEQPYQPTPPTLSNNSSNSSAQKRKASFSIESPQEFT
ncbi:hypothetical protein F4802DRAFT_611421 [Xylaria palmicola]|nr:hypothetical protein F4802DRAFT_611421 [Xylaria palmicola]